MSTVLASLQLLVKCPGSNCGGAVRPTACFGSLLRHIPAVLVSRSLSSKGGIVEDSAFLFRGSSAATAEIRRMSRIRSPSVSETPLVLEIVFFLPSITRNREKRAGLGEAAWCSSSANVRSQPMEILHKLVPHATLRCLCMALNLALIEV